MVWNPNTEQVDAFTQNRPEVNYLMAPPIYLFTRTIRHLIFCRAEGTLIVPSLERSQFYPFLFEKKSFLLQLYSRYFRVWTRPKHFSQGRNTKALIGLSSFKSRLLAVRFELRNVYLHYRSKKAIEYDQEIPQSQTADKPMAPRGRATQPSRYTRKTN